MGTKPTNRTNRTNPTNPSTPVIVTPPHLPTAAGPVAGDVTVNIDSPFRSSSDVNVPPQPKPNQLAPQTSSKTMLSIETPLSPFSPDSLAPPPMARMSRYSLRSSVGYTSNAPSQLRPLDLQSNLMSNFESVMTHSPANGLSLPNDPTFTLMSHTKDAMGDGITVLVPLETSLNKINSNGRIVGHRGVAAPQRTRTSQTLKLQAASKRKLEKLGSSGFVYTDEYDADRRDTRLKVGKELEATKRITAFTGDEHQGDLVANPPAIPVTTVVFELEHVLTTNIDKLRFKSHEDVMSMNPHREKLCFGGEHRIEAIQEFLERIHERNDGAEDGRESVKCFILSDESSKMVLQLLMDINLVKYFISRFGDQLVSHVIGSDHGMAKETNHKKHLILLKLLDSLGRAHDEMLYIGNGKQDINHFQSIGLCRTYLNETQGLTNEGMDKLLASFF